MPKYYTPRKPVIGFANTGSAALKRMTQAVEPIGEYTDDKATKLVHLGGVIRFKRDDFRKYLATSLFPPYPFDANPSTSPPSQEQLIQLTGSNFSSGTHVFIDGVPVTSTYLNPNHLMFVSPLISGNTEHAAVVTVQRPDGLTASNPSIFAFEYNPYLLSISSSLPTGSYPASASFIQGETAVELIGFYFKHGSIIRVSSGSTTAVSTEVVWESAQSMSALTPAVPATGTYSLFVRSPSGLESNPLNITYIYHYPVLTSLLPPSGATDGGDAVVITGSYFLTGALVFLSGVDMSATWITGTRMSFTTPAHASGVVPVYVQNPDGQNSVTASFRFILGLPRITSISPQLGSTGSIFQVQGKYFTSPNLTSMYLVSSPNPTATIPVPQFTVVSNTSASFVMPTASAGDYVLYVSSAAGIGVNVTATIGYRTNPLITSVVPATGGTAGNFYADIYGNNFLVDTSWTLGGAPATTIYVDASHIQLYIPPGTGTLSIVATNYGKFSGSGSFTYASVSGVLSGGMWVSNV